MLQIPISYVELPSDNTEGSKAFYGSLFGWTFQDFSPTYTAFENSGIGGGFQADPADRTASPLICIETADLESLHSRLQAAGGAITAPTFAYPGGRRFHFKDPAGNELAAIQKD